MRVQLARLARKALLVTSCAGLVCASALAQDVPLVVNGASPDQNEQFLCGKTVVVMFNALRYTDAQLAVSNNYTLPTDVTLFPSVSKASDISPAPASVAGAASGAMSHGMFASTGSAAAVQRAIDHVRTAEQLVAHFQQSVMMLSAEVESIVSSADDAQIVRQAADPSIPIASTVVGRAHQLALNIALMPSWPTDAIADATFFVRSAQAMEMTAAQAKVVNSLATLVATMQKAAADPTDPSTEAALSLRVWRELLADVEPSSFSLARTVPCPPGAYANNATVSFVAVDRTIDMAASTAPSDSTTPTAGASSGSHKVQNLGELAGQTAAGTSAVQSAAAHTASVVKNVAVVNGPSRLTATQGIGYSAVPSQSYQLGTTLQGGSAVSQVQPNRADTGQPFLMTTLVHYRFNNPGPIGIHATVGLTSSKGQFLNGMVGASVSFNQAMYFTVGIFRADTTVLNGYSLGQIVPSGTALTTTTQGVSRVGFAISIPIFPAESGKGKTPTAASPSPSPSPK